MNAQASLASSHIERVAEELLSVDTADMRFLAVYFEEEFPLYELRYTFAYSFSRPRTMRFPLSGRAREFHPLDYAHVGRTKKPDST